MSDRRSENSFTAPEMPRGVAYGFVWTTHRTPLLPAIIADELTARGFVPGFVSEESGGAPLSEVGLADATLTPDGPGWRVISMASGRGEGCRLTAENVAPETVPDVYVLRRAVPRPRLVYTLRAGGPSNSDRSLTEQLAEVLMLATNGAALVGGLGTRGNQPTFHHTEWLRFKRPS